MKVTDWAPALASRHHEVTVIVQKLWQAGDFPMDVQSLYGRGYLQNAELIIKAISQKPFLSFFVVRVGLHRSGYVALDVDYGVRSRP